MKVYTKEVAESCLEALYNSGSQTQVDRNMYNYLKGFIEQKGEVKVIKDENAVNDFKRKFLLQCEEVATLERQLTLQTELAELYKSRVKKASAILKGNND